MEFNIGDRVKVPCTFQPGAFNDERLIIINTGHEQLSGFIKSEYLTEAEGNKGYLVGIVINTEEQFVGIQLKGSFFTSATGQAYISNDWATHNLEPAAA